MVWTDERGEEGAPGRGIRRGVAVAATAARALTPGLAAPIFHT